MIKVRRLDTVMRKMQIKECVIVEIAVPGNMRVERKRRRLGRMETCVES